MASNTSHSTASSKDANLPLRSSAPSTQTTAPATAPATAESISIPDGRRNSQGEVLQSPTATWKPNFNRTQSWNQEDLKRTFYVSALSADADKTLGGEKNGFTEGSHEKTSTESVQGNELGMKKDNDQN